MGKTIFLIGFLCLALACSTRAWETPVFMCYWGSWYTVPYPGNFSLDNFDANACTHLIYSFVEIDPESAQPKYPDNFYDSLRAMWKKREENPKMKLVMAVGGASDDLSRAFQEISRNCTKRRFFTTQIADELYYNDWDGVDIDWEFPGETDRQLFVDLLADLRKSVDCRAFEAGGDRYYSISIAMSPSPYKIVGYDIEKIDPNIDYYNLMVYDYHFYTSGDRNLKHHSPTKSHPTDSTEDQQKLNAEKSIETMLNATGIKIGKVVLGVGTYGHTWKMRYPEEHNVGQGAFEMGPPGPPGWRNQKGTWSYAEFCHVAANVDPPNTWTYVWDKNYQAPYAYNPITQVWISYDDDRSVITKTDLAMGADRKDSPLGGMMVWSIELDDCNNICGGWIRCPLISAVKNRLEYWYDWRTEQYNAASDPPKRPNVTEADCPVPACDAGTITTPLPIHFSPSIP